MYLVYSAGAASKLSLRINCLSLVLVNNLTSKTFNGIQRFDESVQTCSEFAHHFCLGRLLVLAEEGIRSLESGCFGGNKQVNDGWKVAIKEVGSSI